MCDYSLMHIASRSAKVGDKLETTNFHNSCSRGFCSVGDNSVAVCVLPGTEIGFEADIAVEGKILHYRVAKFRQVNMDNPYTHHDALELPDESLVLVTRLVPGQGATILQLPAAPRTANEVKTQERLEVVA